MQKTYLTYNRVINLLCVFYYLFDWHKNSIGYIKEKYFRIFNGVADKVTVKKRKIYSDCISDRDIEYFNVQLPLYEKKWGKLTDDEILICFSFYHLANGFLTIDKLTERYNKLYSSYSFINKESQKIGLHDLYKNSVTEFENRYKKELNVIDRASKINKLCGWLDIN